MDLLEKADVVKTNEAAFPLVDVIYVGMEEVNIIIIIIINPHYSYSFLLLFLLFKFKCFSSQNQILRREQTTQNIFIPVLSLLSFFLGGDKTKNVIK